MKGKWAASASSPVLFDEGWEDGKEMDRRRAHCDLINAAVHVLQSHHTTFGGFHVKGSGLGHVTINGNLRDCNSAVCGWRVWLQK